jgi:BirA family biotin operon repressor/biotin-[acetyl-CoA-carboxylase] ligase
LSAEPLSAAPLSAGAGAAAAAWPAGIGRVEVETIDSTNAEAARRHAAGSGPVWIRAGFQTEGRGRRGRAWVSPPGNFHASLLMPWSGPPRGAALLSFAAALALREALVVRGVPAAALALKWPNDVLLAGGKVAGILLETAGSRGAVDHVVIGMGVNLIAAPEAAEVEPGALRPVSVLAEAGLRIDPARLLDALAPAFAARAGTLIAQGFAPLRAEWLAHAARLGAPIRARTGTATYVGRFETVDDTGALVLATAEGRRAIPAADVFF